MKNSNIQSLFLTLDFRKNILCPLAGKVEQQHKSSILIIAVMFIYIYIFGVRLHGIDRRKLEKNTVLPVLWIPL